MLSLRRGLLSITLALLAVHLPARSDEQPAAAGKEFAIERDVAIRMRDGVRLAADIYRPAAKSEQRLGTVFIPTPYSKSEEYGALSLPQVLAGAGFAVVMEDWRGRYQSEGIWSGIPGGAPGDIVDSLDWIIEQPWSNGRVGMIGCSAGGHAALLGALIGHPAIKAVVSAGAGGPSSNLSDLAHDRMVFGRGTVLTGPLLYWMEYVATAGNASNPNAPRSATVSVPMPTVTPREYQSSAAVQKALAHRPVMEQFRMLGLNDPMYEAVWKSWITQSPLPRERLSPYITESTVAAAPILHVYSWGDYSATPVIAHAELFARAGKTALTRDNQPVIISPTTHCDSEEASENTVVGERALGDARFPYIATYIQWFRHWLTNDSPGNFAAPKFRYYQMGENAWKTSQVWPPRGVEPVQFYLSSGGHANTRHGDGTLLRSAPRKDSRDDLIHDPSEPVPTLGGFGMERPDGFYDQSRIEEREDVLVYSTPPFAQDLQVAGPVIAVLHVSTSARDADFFVKLIDVYPDGRAFNVLNGGRRLRYREDVRRESPAAEPGRIYRLEVDVGSTANTFKRGHRLRVEVSSSDFPRVVPNPGTDGPIHLATTAVKATNSIHMSEAAPSHVALMARPSGRD